MHQIYVASSRRNDHQQDLVDLLRDENYEVYDLKNPGDDHTGFHWSEIDEDYKTWTWEDFIDGLDTDVAKRGFKSDMKALQSADTVVLVLPCGRSAHLELGWAVGAGLRTAVYIPPGTEVVPELMYSMCDIVTTSLDDLMAFLDQAN